MEAPKEYLKKHENYERVNFKDGLEHVLELLNAKIDVYVDNKTNKENEGVKFLVKEGDELKTFFTSSIDLITKLSDIEEKTMVKITQVKYFGNNNKELTGYNVSKLVGDAYEKVGEDIQDSDSLPTINADEPLEDIAF
jgi:hypothetical protein